MGRNIYLIPSLLPLSLLSEANLAVVFFKYLYRRARLYFVTFAM